MKVEEPILEYGQLDLNGSYTYADYLRWQFKERVELIKGKIIKISPAPNVKHQLILGNLHAILHSMLTGHPCKVFIAPFDVRLPVPSSKKNSTIVQPDLCIICNTKILDEQGCNGAPDFVIEVLSPGNSRHEMKTKFELYEESGVKEYWLIQPDSKAIFIYTLVNGHYIGLRPFSEGQQLESPLFPEMKISVDEIFSNLN